MVLKFGILFSLIFLTATSGCVHTEQPHSDTSATSRIPQTAQSQAMAPIEPDNNQLADHPKPRKTRKVVQTSEQASQELVWALPAFSAADAKATQPKEPSDPPAPEAFPASSAGDDHGGLTLVALEEMALINNPTLAQGEALIRQAEGNWFQVGLYPNPAAGYTASEIGQEGEAGQEGAFVSQTIVTANKLELNRAVASWDVERARWHRETQQVRVLNDVRIRFYEALGAQRTVEIAEELQKVAEAGVKTSQEKFEAKQVAQPDVLQAEIQLNQVAILLQNARFREHAARQQLANTIGVPALPPQPFTGTLDEELAEVDHERIWQEVCEANPLLQAARAQVQRAQMQIQREQVEPIPDVQTQFSLQYDAATDFTVANAQVGVALPIFNRNRGNISAAAAKMHRAAANVQRLELVLRDRLAETYRRYGSAQNQVERYRDNILPKAQKNLDLTTQAYEAGEFDFLRVLTARQTLFQAEVDYIASLTNLRQSLIELDGLLLTGGLSDPAEDAVNPGGGGGGTQALTDTPKTE